MQQVPISMVPAKTHLQKMLQGCVCGRDRVILPNLATCMRRPRTRRPCGATWRGARPWCRAAAGGPVPIQARPTRGGSPWRTWPAGPAGRKGIGTLEAIQRRGIKLDAAPGGPGGGGEGGPPGGRKAQQGALAHLRARVIPTQEKFNPHVYLGTLHWVRGLGSWGTQCTRCNAGVVALVSRFYWTALLKAVSAIRIH